MDKTTDKSCTETVVPEVFTHLLMNHVTVFDFALPKIYYILTYSWMHVFAFNTMPTLLVFMIPTDFGIPASVTRTHPRSVAETLLGPEDALAAPEAAVPGTGTGAGSKDIPPAGAEAPPAVAASKAAATIASGAFPGALPENAFAAPEAAAPGTGT